MYLTFDIGTTSVKVVLFDPNGRVIGKAIRNYALEMPEVNWYEVNPETYWDAVVSGIREVLSVTRVSAGEVRSVSGCSQGETVVFLSADGRPVRPAIVWLDLRAREEAAELASLATREEMYAVTGVTDVDPTWTATKILWVKRHDPTAFARTARIFLVEDYITWRLTGRACSTTNLLSTSLLVDVHRHTYWDKFVDFLGIAGLLPQIIEPGDMVETLSFAAARTLGLEPTTLVVKGAMDQATSALGAGNCAPGIVTETTGSVMAIGVTTPSVATESLVRLPYLPHVVPGSFLFLPYVQTAGGAFKWWRDNFCAEEIRAAGDPEAAYERMDRQAAAVSAGSEGVVFLPFLAGAGQPENDPDARAVFYGLTLMHGKGHCARAIMESIAFMLRKILSDIRRLGISITEIRSMGGGARSDLWLQIKADVTGIPVVRMEEETSSLGAAILAAVRLGERPNLTAATAAMVHRGRRFEPDPSAGKEYETSYALYNELHNALIPVFRRFSQ